MKANIIHMIFLLLLISCVQDLEEPNRFIKVIGDETTSIGERIIALPDGNIAVLGKTGILAASYNAENYIENLEDQSGSVSILDENGNLIRSMYFPIESFKSEYFEVTNTANGVVLKDLISLSDGTYVAVAQMRDFEFRYDSPDGIVEGEGGVAPLIIKLDENFEVIKYLNMNGEEGWTGDFSIRAHIKKFPFSDDIMVLTTNFEYCQPNPCPPKGYSLLRLNSDLDTLDAERFDVDKFNSTGIKSAENFDFDPAGHVVMIGQRNNRLWTYSVPTDDLNYQLEQISDIDINGTFGWNNNEHFIISREDGFHTLLYTDAPYQVKFVEINSSMNTFRDVVIIDDYREDEPPVGNYPRAFFRTQNGDYLALLIHIPQEESVPNWSTLHRLNPDGIEIFQIRLDGFPGDVMETEDGDILVMTNTRFNNSLYKMTLRKLSADGKLY